MVIVLMEDSVYSIDSFLKKIYSRFPVTSVLNVDKRNLNESLSKMETQPLLTDGWAIIVNKRVSISQSIKFCNSDSNLVVLWINPKDKMEVELKLNENKIKYRVLDNLNVSKDALITYTCNELNLDTKEAKTLCNRCNNYLPYVLESVTLLKSLGRDVKRKDILKYIEKKNQINAHSLFLYFIGYKYYDSSQVSTYLYDFRYAFSYIKESLLKYLEDAIEIYLLMEQGFLGADNFKSYDFGRSMVFSEYSMKSLILDVHSSVNLEKLIFTKIKIEKSSLHDLLNYVE